MTIQFSTFLGICNHIVQWKIFHSMEDLSQIFLLFFINWTGRNGKSNRVLQKVDWNLSWSEISAAEPRIIIARGGLWLIKAKFWLPLTGCTNFKLQCNANANNVFSHRCESRVLLQIVLFMSVASEDCLSSFVLLDLLLFFSSAVTKNGYCYPSLAFITQYLLHLCEFLRAEDLFIY